MKKTLEFLKLFLLFIIGYCFFFLIATGIEIFLLTLLSDSNFSYEALLIKNLKDSFLLYSLIFLLIFILNFIYNFIFVKLLNKKLNQINRKDDFYEK